MNPNIVKIKNMSLPANMSSGTVGHLIYFLQILASFDFNLCLYFIFSRCWYPVTIEVMLTCQRSTSLWYRWWKGKKKEICRQFYHMAAQHLCTSNSTTFTVSFECFSLCSVWFMSIQGQICQIIVPELCSCNWICYGGSGVIKESRIFTNRHWQLYAMDSNSCYQSRI